MSNPLTTETLEELERLYGRLQAITDHPLEVDQDADEPAIIYVHSRGEKCADGRHHTYMVGLAHMSEDWKDDGRPLADAVVAIINAFPALLAAARERETALARVETLEDELETAQINERSAVANCDANYVLYREARQEIAALKAVGSRVSALEGALRELERETATLRRNISPSTIDLRARGQLDVYLWIERKLARAILTSTPETPADDGGRNA